MIGKKTVKKNGKRWKKNGHLLACPHCGAGAGDTVGIYWDFYEHCWRCIICGYREYDTTARNKSKKQLAQERMIEQIMDSPG